MLTLTKKLTVPEVFPLVQAYFAKHESTIFHVMLEDGNYGHNTARSQCEDARARGDSEAIVIADILVQMTKTQRARIADMLYTGANE